MVGQQSHRVIASARALDSAGTTRQETILAGQKAMSPQPP